MHRATGMWLRIENQRERHGAGVGCGIGSQRCGVRPVRGRSCGVDVDQPAVRRRERSVVVVVEGGESSRRFGATPIAGQPPQPHAGHIQVCNLIRLDVM